MKYPTLIYRSLKKSLTTNFDKVKRDGVFYWDDGVMHSGYIITESKKKKWSVRIEIEFLDDAS